MLRFAVYDWEDKHSEDTSDQDDLGTLECTVAEVIRGNAGRRFVVHQSNVQVQYNIALCSSFRRFERGLSPYKHTPGDSGILTIYAEEKAGLTDDVKSNLLTIETF